MDALFVKAPFRLRSPGDGYVGAFGGEGLACNICLSCRDTGATQPPSTTIEGACYDGSAVRVREEHWTL